MYYVYLLKSKRDNRFYVGYTSDLRLRYKQHQEGEVEATTHRRPLELVYYEAYSTEELARTREEKLKQFGSAFVGLLKRLGLK